MAQQLTGLHAKFTGDSSSFTRATKLAQLEANKLDAQMRKSKREQDALAASGEGLARQYHQLRMETDNAYAAQVRFEKAARLARQTAEAQQWSVEQLNSELMRLAGHYRIAEVAGLSMNEQVRSARFHTANLAAQFNDIGVMLAAGQSPFMLAIQQGTQITQVLQDMGGGARQTFKALGSAFMSIISPTSLLTIGLIAGGAALAQWGMEALGASEETNNVNKAIEALTAGMENYIEYAKTAATDTATLAEEFGGFAGQIKEFSAYLAGVALAKTMEELDAAMIPLKESLGSFERQLIDVAMQEEEVARLTEQFKQGITEFSSVQIATDMLDGFVSNLEATAGSLGLTREQATLLKMLMDELGQAETMAEIARAAGEVLRYMKQIVPAGQDLPPQLREAAIALETMQKKAAQASVEVTKLGDSAPGAGWMGEAITETNALISSLIAANAEKDKLLSRSGANYETELGLTGQSSGPDAARTQQMGGGLFAAPVRGAGQAFVAAAGGGRGGGAANAIQNQLEQLQNSLLSQEQLEMESYQRRQELLDQALQKKMISQQDHARLMEQVEATHQFAMLKEQNKGVSNTLSALGSLFQGSKKIGAAVALANSWIAFTEVLKDPAYIGRPWARFAAAASALSSGLNAVRNIKSAQPGGSSGGAVSGVGGGAASAPAAAPQTSSQVALQLVGGDMFSRDQVMKLINAINDATADGARIILR